MFSETLVPYKTQDPRYHAWVTLSVRLTLLMMILTPLSSFLISSISLTFWVLNLGKSNSTQSFKTWKASLFGSEETPYFSYASKAHLRNWTFSHFAFSTAFGLASSACSYLSK